jgi:hypothetical protein
LTATTELALQCRCGIVRGVLAVAPASGNHCVCYCKDCQAFAHFLGRADDMLDAQGGTDIFQTSQAHLALHTGHDSVACMRLTTSGLARWYASCCNTPIGNTLATSGVPFIGLTTVFAKGAVAAALGPIRARVHVDSARDGRAAVPAGGLPMPYVLARALWLMLRWRLRGDHRRSPLFAAPGYRPIAEPRVLTAEEREDLRRRCAAWQPAASSTTAAPSA